ncbi:putative toxin-antitoxin system toxin component, PIN family [Candidatus Woesearchaeota archaeon]|nr:putative toxin-antitoxin system toxin component, PIN family [Candidatus Woesearchaeota archaeon]
MKLRQSERVRVVLDTNVIVSAAISEEGNPARVFQLILLGMIENVTTQQIIDEIKEVFERPRIARLISAEGKEFVISNFEKSSIKVMAKSKFDVIKDDSDDNKFIEAAIDGGADYIISGDAHLQELIKFRNIIIFSPKEFLDDFANKHIQ